MCVFVTSSCSSRVLYVTVCVSANFRFLRSQLTMPDTNGSAQWSDTDHVSIYVLSHGGAFFRVALHILPKLPSSKAQPGNPSIINYHACSSDKSCLFRVENGRGDVAPGEIKEFLVIAGDVQPSRFIVPPHGTFSFASFVISTESFPVATGQSRSYQLIQQQQTHECPKSRPDHFD